MQERSRKVLVIAPHPDDETLGCGGTLLRHRAEGDDILWLIATDMGPGYSRSQRARREREIAAVADRFGFSSVTRLGFPASGLDRVPLAKIVSRIGDCLRGVEPQVVYIPHGGDAHSDHRNVFDAAVAAAKSFRAPSVRRLLAYETLSETGFNPDPAADGFRPNVFVDVSAFAARKIQILKLYAGELSRFPFPRSEKAVRALLALRGAASNCRAAEAFVLLKEFS